MTENSALLNAPIVKKKIILRSGLDLNKVIEIPDKSVFYLQEYDGGSTQTVTLYEDKTLDDGTVTYKILITFTGSQYYLSDLLGGHLALTPPAIVFPESLWRFDPGQTLNSYIISNVATGKTITVKNSQTTDGTPLTLEVKRNTSNQEWIISENIPLIPQEPNVDIELDVPITFGSSLNTNKVIDIADDKVVNFWDYNGGDNQSWIIHEESSYENKKFYSIKSLTNFYLEDTDGKLTISPVFTNSEEMLWRFELGKEANSFIIVNIRTGRVIDLEGSITTNGTPIITWSRQGSQNQEWAVNRRMVIPENKNDQTFDGKIVRIHSTMDNNFVFDVTSAGTVNLSVTTGDSGQEWIFKLDRFANNYTIEIQSENNGARFLSDIDDSLISLSPVQWKGRLGWENAVTSNSSKWVIVNDWDTSWKILNVGTGRAIDMTGDILTDRVLLCTWPDSNTDDQHWTIEIIPEYSIVVTSDAQYPWTAVTDEGINENEEQQKVESERLIRSQYTSINDYSSYIGNRVIHTFMNGDMTAYGHEWQWSKMDELLELLKMSYSISLGNHDIENNFGDTFLNDAWRNSFMRLWDFQPKNVIHQDTWTEKYALSDFKYCGSLNYSQTIGDFHVIVANNYPTMVNSVSIYDPSDLSNVVYWLTSGLEFIKNELEIAENTGTAAILFIHKPNDWEWGQDSDGIFKAMVEKHYDAGTLKAVFVGHYHYTLGKVSYPEHFGHVPVYSSGSSSQQSYLILEVEKQETMKNLNIYSVKNNNWKEKILIDSISVL